MSVVKLFHGSQTDNIAVLEPRKRYTPGRETAPPAAIYASDLPAFSAAHAFPWSSSEGIDLSIDGSNVVLLEIPKLLEGRLKDPIFIYEVSPERFQPVESDQCGHNFRCIEPVKCIAKTRFENVTEAVTFYGGIVNIISV